MMSITFFHEDYESEFSKAYKILKILQQESKKPQISRLNYFDCIKDIKFKLDEKTLANIIEKCQNDSSLFKIATNQLEDFETYRVRQDGKIICGNPVTRKSEIDFVSLKFNHAVVLKELPLNFGIEKDRKEIIKQCVILSLVSHPNLIKYICNFQKNFDGKENIVMFTDYSENLETMQDIYISKQRSKYLTNECKKFTLLDILKGLSHLHQYNIVHGNIRPENILIGIINSHGNDLYVKISDFTLPIDQPSKFVDLVYLAPEFYNPEIKNYSTAYDVYSLGVLIQFMILENHPKIVIPQLETILTKSLEYEKYIPQVNDSMKIFETIIRKCWIKDPNQRLKMQDVLNLLEKSLL